MLQFERASGEAGSRPDRPMGDAPAGWARRRRGRAPSEGQRWAWLVLALGGCGAPGPAPELVAARATLAALMVDRSAVDVSAVSEAATAAARWKGEDADLDLLLGDALANVLMRPSDGLALLNARPQPDSLAWQRAVGGGALRTRTGIAVAAAEALDALGPVDEDAPWVGWMASRALRDPALGWLDLEAVDAACGLLDQQPQRGRRPVDLPLASGLLDTARAEGARLVVLGRAHATTDPEPDSGKGLVPCRSGRLLGETLPVPMPRHVVVGMVGDSPMFEKPLFISLSWGPDREPWVLASHRPDDANRLIQAALDRVANPVKL